MEKKIVRTAVYYSPHRKQSFEVPIRDKNGEEMLQKDRFGNLVLGRNSQPVPLMKNENFRVLIDSPKVGYQCVYRMDFVLDAAGDEVPVDADVYAQLEKLADDPATKVIREDTYKAQMNPTAFELEKQVREKDRVINSLRDEIAKVNTQSSDAVSAMQREMAELKTLLEEKTKPTSSAVDVDAARRGPGRPPKSE
jgi:hypothetical protein